MKFLNFNFIVRNLTTLRTNVRYPNVERGWFKNLKIEDINFFKSILLPSQVIIDEAIIDSYNTDWLKECKGCSQLLLRPYSTTEISKILQYCNQERLAIVPQGGNTGLAHGSIPVFDEIILSMSSMNKVKYIDSLSGIMVCEAGCVLKTLEDTLSEKGMIMPYDLGARDSCQIGGNIATHAGGVRFVRYGPLRAYVVGLEAVLPNGEILDCMNTVRKDNTGYDLKQLFIGSEGTLGVITKVALYCPPKPADTCTAFYGCNNFEDIIEAFKLAKSQLGETLSAFEFMDQGSMASVVNNLRLSIPNELMMNTGTGNKMSQTFYKFYALIETSTSSTASHLGNQLEEFSSKLQDLKYPTNEKDLGIVIAQNVQQAKELWQLRESITLSLLSDGYVYKYDLSLPITKFYELVQIMNQHMIPTISDTKSNLSNTPVIRVVGYGHVGDGNLHLNITSRTFDPDLLASIQPFIYQQLLHISSADTSFTHTADCFASADHGKGYSISAEHGIGLSKLEFVQKYAAKNNVFWSLTRQIKKTFDPHGILNPYKCLPPPPLQEIDK